jgi:tRNA threonylcarbamoyladenosine biosynthesis protein TsaE
MESAADTMKSESFISRSPEETGEYFREMARGSKRGDVYALMGNLGTGKTLISRAMAGGLGIEDDITSPTFTLMEIYEGPLTLYHFDLYRIEHERELDNLFFEEYWEGDGVSIIEWADRAMDRLPPHAIKIYLEYIDEDSRRITIEYPDL